MCLQDTNDSVKIILKIAVVYTTVTIIINSCSFVGDPEMINQLCLPN